MRKTIFILILIVVHNSQLVSATLNSTKDWDFSYDLNKKIKTEKLHADINICFNCSYSENGASIYYEEDKKVSGSKEPNVVEISFNKVLEITKEQANTFKSNLEQTGINELQHLPRVFTQRRDLYWQEQITFNSITESFYYPAEEGIRYDVNEVIFSFINELGLNEPEEPKKIDLSVLDETYSYLSLELKEPLRLNPVYFHGKKIKSMVVYEEQGIKNTIITIVDSNEQVIDIWNATIPDSNGEHASYEGQAAYEGKTIEFILTNTQITTTEGDSEPSRKVTLQEIFENPDKYHGKRVCVKGFYNLQFEGHDFHDRLGNNVWIDQWSSFTKKKWEYGPIPNILEAIFLGKQRGYATVEGVFLKGPGGHFGMWPGEIVRITRFDAHFKVEYFFWLLFLVIVLGSVFLIRRFRKKKLKLKVIG